MLQAPLSEDAQKAMQEKLQHLVDLAFEKGLLEAISQARKTSDPYLLDAFHDILTDKLYQELVVQHKLQELK